MHPESLRLARVGPGGFALFFLATAALPADLHALHPTRLPLLGAGFPVEVQILGCIAGVLIIAALSVYGHRRRDHLRQTTRTQEKAAALAQRRLASILEHTSDLVAFADANRKPLYLNAAGRRLLGVGPDEDLSQWSAPDLYPQWANDLIVKEGLPIAMKEGVWRGQTAVRNRSGREIPTSQVITAHFSPEGKLDFTAAIIRDITPLIQAAKAVETSEARYRSLWESCPMGIFTYELQPGDRLVLIGANPAADRILGVANKVFLGKTIEEAFPALAKTEVPAAFRRAALSGQPWFSEQLEYDHDNIRGAFELYAFQTSPRRMAVMFLEVTARKQAELALRESEERFRQLAGSIREVFYLVDWPDRNFAYVSPAFGALWGKRPSDLYANPALWTASIETSDLERVATDLKEHIEEGEWTDEYRIRHTDGSVHWIRDRSFAIRNDLGQIHRLAGVAEDVTDQHQSEAAERAFRRLAQSLVGSLSLHDLGQTVALTCRCLFHHHAFFLELIHPQTGERTPAYAEDTRPGSPDPEEVKSELPKLSSVVLDRLGKGQATLLDHPTEGDPALGPWGFRERPSASTLLSPVVSEGRCIGLISIHSYDAGRFSSREADLLQTLANQCASTLLRVRAEEDLHRLNRQLESRIRDCTEELQRIINLLAGREIRSTKLEEEIKTLRQHLTPPPPAAD